MSKSYKELFIKCCKSNVVIEWLFEDHFRRE